MDIINNGTNYDYVFLMALPAQHVELGHTSLELNEVKINYIFSLYSTYSKKEFS